MPRQRANRGYYCDRCGHDRSYVLETRADIFLRRRRRCPKCNHRWDTYEVPAELIDEKPDDTVAETIKQRMKERK